MKTLRRALLGLLISAVPLAGFADSPPGLNQEAYAELEAAGVTKYLGMYTPALAEELEDGWTRHTFDPDGVNGPLCIAGTPYSVFSKIRNPSKLLIFLQGGGACWQDFYFCNILADDAPPPLAGPSSGIWVDSFDAGDHVIPNPLQDYSVVYLPYCDGSVFSGDNDVVDANFPFGPVRFHRGLRNLTAGMDLARRLVPHAQRVMVAGSSAGGVGSAAFAPFLARFEYGNRVNLSVFNDAGPVAVNLADVGAVQARAADWQFGQFYPESCEACDDQGQQTALIRWRLDNDRSIREAFYSTDGDATNRFFVSVPTQAQYRDLILAEHGALTAAHPRRYKRFIRSGDDEHTALQRPTFYLGTANGYPLWLWTANFQVPTPFWIDIVEDFVPLP